MSDLNGCILFSAIVIAILLFWNFGMTWWAGLVCIIFVFQVAQDLHGK